MVRISKTKVRGKFLYINLLDFKDELEQNQIYEQVKNLLHARQEYMINKRLQDKTNEHEEINEKLKNIWIRRF